MENKLPTSDIDFLLSLIPQRPPFVMIGELLEYTSNTLVSKFLITEENIFSHEGLFQASGVIEHQAQSVALHNGYKYYLSGKAAPTGYIGAIKSFEAIRLPKVGDVLTSDVTIYNEILGVTSVGIVTKVNDVIIAEAQMKTVVK